jgi:hypothetical protein
VNKFWNLAWKRNWDWASALVTARADLFLNDSFAAARVALLGELGSEELSKVAHCLLRCGGFAPDEFEEAHAILMSLEWSAIPSDFEEAVKAEVARISSPDDPKCELLVTLANRGLRDIVREAVKNSNGLAESLVSELAG